MKDIFDKKHTDSFVFKFYNSGSVAPEGTYICKNCGQKLFMQKSSVLPVCSKCGNSVFTRQ